MRVTLTYLLSASLMASFAALSMESEQPIELPDAELRGEISIEEEVKGLMNIILTIRLLKTTE